MNNIEENIKKLHTTDASTKKIKKSLNIKGNVNVEKYCINKIIEKNTMVILNGKNYYCYNGNVVLTVNSNNFTIINASYI